MMAMVEIAATGRSDSGRAITGQVARLRVAASGDENRETGNRHGEAEALNCLGMVVLATGDRTERQGGAPPRSSWPVQSDPSRTIPMS